MPKIILDQLSDHLTNATRQVTTPLVTAFIEELLNGLDSPPKAEFEIAEYLDSLKIEVVKFVRTVEVEGNDVTVLKDRLVENAENIVARSLGEIVVAVPEMAGKAPSIDAYESKEKGDGPASNVAERAPDYFASACRIIKADIEPDTLTEAVKERLKKQRNALLKSDIYLELQLSKFEFMHYVPKLILTLETLLDLLSNHTNIELVLTKTESDWIKGVGNNEVLPEPAIVKHLIATAKEFVRIHHGLGRDVECFLNDFRKCEIVFIEHTNASYHGKSVPNISEALHVICLLDRIMDRAADSEAEQERGLTWAEVENVITWATKDVVGNGGVIHDSIRLISVAKDQMKEAGELPAKFLNDLDKPEYEILARTYNIFHLKLEIEALK